MNVFTKFSNLIWIWNSYTVLKSICFMKRALLKIYFTIKCQLYGIKNIASNSMHYGEKWINNLFYEFYNAATCYNAKKENFLKIN